MVTATMVVAAAAAMAVAVAMAAAAAAAAASEQIHSVAGSQSSLWGKKHVALFPFPRLYISELLQGAAILGEARPLPGSFPRKCPDRLTQKCVS